MSRRDDSKASPVYTEAAVLQVLEDGDNYVAGIIEAVAERTNSELILLHSSVYNALRTLRRRGLVSCYDLKVGFNGGGTARSYYALTQQGRDLADRHRRILQMMFGPDGPAPISLAATNGHLNGHANGTNKVYEAQTA